MSRPKLLDLFDDRTFVQRVAEDREHFPWWYTEYGVVCSCSRPCPGGGEMCAVMLRAQRWQDGAA